MPRVRAPPLHLNTGYPGAAQMGGIVHNSALRFRPGAHRHPRGRGRSAVACAGYHRAGGPGLLTRLCAAAFVIHREQAPARVDDFVEPLFTHGHS